MKKLFDRQKLSGWMLTRQSGVNHSCEYGCWDESWVVECCKRTQSTRNVGDALQGTFEQPARSGQRHIDVLAWKDVQKYGVCEQYTESALGGKGKSTKR